MDKFRWGYDLMENQFREFTFRKKTEWSYTRNNFAKICKINNNKFVTKVKSGMRWEGESLCSENDFPTLQDAMLSIINNVDQNPTNLRGWRF